MEFQYQVVWKKITPELTQEIVEFWSVEKALPIRENPEARAQQAVVVMRDSNGKIAAVSTAVLSIIPRLQQPLYYYRTFCAEAYRGMGTSIPMMKACQKALHEYNLGLPDPESIGIHIKLENEMLTKHYNMAHWQQTGFNFMGYTPRGHVVRAYYFPGFILKPRSML